MKLYNKSELRYSRIFFDKRPPAFAFILIISTAIILSGALVGAAYIPKNYIVKANGNSVITGTEFLSAISSGKVVTLHKSEGDMVNAGDVIISLSSGQEGLQASSLNKQLVKLRAKEAIFQKSENYNNGTQYSKIQDEYTKLNKITAERNQLDADLQTLQNELIQLQQQGDSPSLSDTTSADDKAKLETKILEITTKIEALKTNITSKNSEIDSQQSNIKDMNRTYNDPTSQAYNIYAQLVSELGTARSNNNKSITELEANLGVATGQDKAHSILAPNEGTLHYLVPLKQGMSIQQGQTIAEVSGKEKGYYVEAFVLASDISRVSKGAKADVAITGVNSQKYGTLKGQVRQIDSGTISQETKEGNISLYKVMIELETLTLKHGSETVVLQKDMPVEVRIVYDKETYLDWILEMLSFKQ